MSGSADRILVTGLSGTIGSELAGRLAGLVDELGGDVELVATFSGRRSREHFLRDADPGLRAILRPVVCDLANDGSVGLLAGALGVVDRTVVVHAATSTNAPPRITENVVRLARLTSRSPRLIHVSTAPAPIERVLRNCPDIAVSTFSHALIVGHSRTGAHPRFDGLYPLLHLLEAGQLPAIPAHRTLDIVPIDWVADQLYHQLAAACQGDEPGDTIASSGDQAPQFSDLLTLIVTTLNRHRLAQARPPLPAPELLPPMPILDPALAAHLSDGTIVSPRGTISPAPPVSSYLDRVVTFWLSHTTRDIQLNRAA